MWHGSVLLESIIITHRFKHRCITHETAMPSTSSIAQLRKWYLQFKFILYAIGYAWIYYKLLIDKNNDSVTSHDFYPPFFRHKLSHFLRPIPFEAWHTSWTVPSFYLLLLLFVYCLLLTYLILHLYTFIFCTYLLLNLLLLSIYFFYFYFLFHSFNDLLNFKLAPSMVYLLLRYFL